MKKYIIILLFTGIFLFSGYAADCPCGEKGIAKHKRVHIKDRSMGNPADATAFTFSQLYKLKITAAQLKQINADSALVLPNENQVISITGYLRILKLSADDCDLHMEIAADKNPVSNRIIAEIPNTAEYCPLRQQVFDELSSQYNLTEKKLYKFGTKQLKALPKVTVYGYVFFDNGHPTGHNHGSIYVKTIWEVHPVFKVEWD